MSRYQRQKGRAFEQAVARILRVHGFDDVRRGWQSREGCDDPDVIGVPGWWIECGKGKSINPRAKFAQAVEASGGKGLRAVAITMDDRGEPLATVRLCDWLRLVHLTLHGDDWYPSEAPSKPITVADLPRSESLPGYRCDVQIAGGGKP